MSVRIYVVVIVCVMLSGCAPTPPSEPYLTHFEHSQRDFLGGHLTFLVSERWREWEAFDKRASSSLAIRSESAACTGLITHFDHSIYYSIIDVGEQISIKFHAIDGEVSCTTSAGLAKFRVYPHFSRHPPFDPEEPFGAVGFEVVLRTIID